MRRVANNWYARHSTECLQRWPTLAAMSRAKRCWSHSSVRFQRHRYRSSRLSAGIAGGTSVSIARGLRRSTRAAGRYTPSLAGAMSCVSALAGAQSKPSRKITSVSVSLAAAAPAAVVANPTVFPLAAAGTVALTVHVSELLGGNVTVSLNNEPLLLAVQV